MGKTHFKDRMADTRRLKVVFLPYNFYAFWCPEMFRFPRQFWGCAVAPQHFLVTQQVP